MVLRTQSTYDLTEEIEPQLEVLNQTTEAKQYVMDLLTELQGIARVSGLEGISNDLKIVLSRHLPKQDIV